MTTNTQTTPSEGVVVSVSSHCECAYCGTCEVLFSADDRLCPECSEEGSDTQCCDGFCYESAVESFDELWNELFSDVPFIAEWGGVGWLRRSDRIIVPDGMDAAEARDRLTFSGDWRLKCTFSEDGVHVTRYSHDEPTGASFDFRTLNPGQRRVFEALVEDGLEDDDLIEAFHATRAVA